jgi:hypothetical protein
MIQPLIEVPLPYQDLAAEGLRFTSEAGSLTYLNPKAPPTIRSYCIAFPGYTGDALSHVAFNRTALELGLSVLCVNPRWGNSTHRIRAHTTALLDEAQRLGIDEDQPFFVRGVSFGCDLSLAWLEDRHRNPTKIAWITPCSAAHLEHAGKMMGLDVRNDARDLSHKVSTPIWIQELVQDAIVPNIDPAFLGASPSHRSTTLTGADHFEAGNLPDASIQIAHWFKESV